MTNPLESKNEDEIDEIFISDPNIYLETDKNGDTIMPEQAKRQIQELIATARIDELVALDEAVNSGLESLSDYIKGSISQLEALQTKKG
jgi:hypothetical protein